MQESHGKQLGPETRHTGVDLHGDSTTQANLGIGGLVEQDWGIILVYNFEKIQFFLLAFLESTCI